MGAIRDFELEGWQAAASSYEGFAGATRLFVDPLLQAADVRPGMRLLDIACGPASRPARRLPRARASRESISRPP